MIFYELVETYQVRIAPWLHEMKYSSMPLNRITAWGCSSRI